MTEIIVKILIELLSTLALATQQVKQGRLSAYLYPSLQHFLLNVIREIRNEASRREGDRSGVAEVGSTEPRGGSDDGGTDTGDCVWTCEEYESGYRRCVSHVKSTIHPALSILSHRWQDLKRRYSAGPRCASFAVRYLWLLTFWTSCDAANCKRYQQVPTFVISSYPHFRLTNRTILVGDQLEDKSRQWLSPADPSSNYNIACGAHHDGTATWFIQGTAFREWEVTGSLLWIHGKRLLLPISCFSFPDNEHSLQRARAKVSSGMHCTDSPPFCSPTHELVPQSSKRLQGCAMPDWP